MGKAIISTGLKQLYFISFIEGGVVMVTEIAGAKILTPYFGASLYSWAATLSITLFALMTGYYFGGYVTTKPKFSHTNNIVWVFFISGLAVLLMPSLGNFVMQKTISFSFFVGLIISEMLFLFSPIFLMGMISPMIIFQITKKVEQSGRSAGNIYAISTSGGILFTLAFGFLIIPHYGINLPVKILGVLVSMIALGLFLKDKLASKKIITNFLIALVLAAIAFNQKKPSNLPPQLNMKMVEYSEGLLGELKVIDELTFPPDGNPVVVRKLKTNNIQQNFVFRDMPTQSLNYYVNFTRQLIPFLPKKNSALLIGLGAGSMYKVLNDQKVKVETVEIDKRIYDIGVKYFGMPSHSNHSITDGRYFINVTDKKYDLVILDAIIGESVPGQLITLESFRRCYEILGADGTLIIEHGGLLNFSDNSFIPSVYNTLMAAGFHVSIFNPLQLDTYGDVLLVASKKEFDVSKISIFSDVFIKGGPLSDYSLSIDNFNNQSANILTDDINNFDVLLKAHYFQIRKGIRKELAKQEGFRNS